MQETFFIKLKTPSKLENDFSTYFDKRHHSFLRILGEISVKPAKVKVLFKWESPAISDHFGPPVTVYVEITFCPFVSLEQRALALALLHISQLKNGMSYQAALEQVTFRNLKGAFRE